MLVLVNKLPLRCGLATLVLLLGDLRRCCFVVGGCAAACTQQGGRTRACCHSRPLLLAPPLRSCC